MAHGSTETADPGDNTRKRRDALNAKPLSSSIRCGAGPGRAPPGRGRAVTGVTGGTKSLPVDDLAREMAHGVDETAQNVAHAISPPESLPGLNAHRHSRAKTERRTHEDQDRDSLRLAAIFRSQRLKPSSNRPDNPGFRPPALRCHEPKGGMYEDQDRDPLRVAAAHRSVRLDTDLETAGQPRSLVHRHSGAMNRKEECMKTQTAIRSGWPPFPDPHG